MRNLINRVAEALKPRNVFPVASIESEIVTAASQIREPRRKADHEPFFQVERLKKNGVRLVSNEIKVGAGGHRYVFVHPSSTGGVLLELVEADSNLPYK